MDCGKCNLRHYRIKCLACEQKEDARAGEQDDRIRSEIITPLKNDPILEYLNRFLTKDKVKVAAYITWKITGVSLEKLAPVFKVSTRTIKRYISKGKEIIESAGNLKIGTIPNK